MLGLETEVTHEDKHLLYPCEDRELSFEGVLSKEGFEDGMLMVSVVLPIGVAHGDLVMVGQQWSDPFFKSFMF